MRALALHYSFEIIRTAKEEGMDKMRQKICGLKTANFDKANLLEKAGQALEYLAEFLIKKIHFYELPITIPTSRKCSTGTRSIKTK